VDDQQPLGGEEPQPEEERHGFLLREVGDALRRFEEGLLEDVGRVHAALEPPVHPEPDHHAQPVAELAEQLPHRAQVPVRRRRDQHVTLALADAQERLPTERLPAERRDRAHFIITAR
jgi:hypothetical protein